MRGFITPIASSSVKCSPFLRQQQQQRAPRFFFRCLIVAATTTTTTTTRTVSSYNNGISSIRTKRHYYSSFTRTTLPTFLASTTSTDTADSSASTPEPSPSSSSFNIHNHHRNPFTMTTTTSSYSPPQQPQAQPPSSFYRRPLPSSCTAFSSKRGRVYLNQAMQNHGLQSFFHLMEQYTTQSEPAYCGISTLVISLNAMQVDPRREWKKPWRWYQEDMLNCCVNLDQVKQTGITMSDFCCLAICQGLQAHAYHAEPLVAATASASTDSATTTITTPSSSTTTMTTTTNGTVCNQCNNAPAAAAPSSNPFYSLQHFRSIIAQACMEKDEHQNDNNDNDDNSDEYDNNEKFLQDILIVSYNRAVLQQSGSGHFSPIAAYDLISDTVLILDTARFKYGAHWVSVDLLYTAMQSIDPATNKSRGYILLHVNRDDDHDDKQQQEQLLSHISKTKTGSTSRPVAVTEYNTSSPTISRQASSSSLLSSSPKQQQAHPDDLSILVRFKLTQESKRARKEFQSKFLILPQQQQQQQSSMTATTTCWQDVYEFWTTTRTCTNNNNSTTTSTTCSSTATTPTFIWDLMEPALTPLRKDTMQLVNDVLALICNVMKITETTTRRQPSPPDVAAAAVKSCGSNNNNNTSLSSSIAVSSSASCRPNFSRTLALQPMQAIWLVYFCLLEEPRRQELLSSVPALSFIFTTTSSGNNNNDNKVDDGNKAKEEEEMTSRATAAREQLLATAETLRLFLEMQDE